MSTESAAPDATTAASALPAGTWKVDPVHSSVEFQVKHLGIATVKGLFKEFEGTLEVGPGGAVAYGTVQTASVDTREPARDEHLRWRTSSRSTSTPRSTSVRPPSARPARTSSRSSATSDPRRHALGHAPGDRRGHRARGSPGSDPRRPLRQHPDQPLGLRDALQRRPRLRQRRRQRQGQDPCRGQRGEAGVAGRVVEEALWRWVSSTTARRPPSVTEAVQTPRDVGA